MLRAFLLRRLALAYFPNHEKDNNWWHGCVELCLIAYRYFRKHEYEILLNFLCLYCRAQTTVTCFATGICGCEPMPLPFTNYQTLTQLCVHHPRVKYGLFYSDWLIIKASLPFPIERLGVAELIPSEGTVISIIGVICPQPKGYHVEVNFSASLS